MLAASKLVWIWSIKRLVIALHQQIMNILYGSANDPRTANDPGPQMIPKLDRKWSQTGNDPR